MLIDDYRFVHQTIQDLLARSKPVDGCLEWQGARHKLGYGRIMSCRRVLLVHRVMYVLQNGPIPHRLCVCHTCDNPPCINIEHLFLGTHKDNSIDASRKKRLTGNITVGEEHSQARLPDDDVLLIRDLLEKFGHVYGMKSKIARDFNISPQIVNQIQKRRTWKHLP